MDVVVVESPTKARNINKYLGSGYRVLSSYGHVRDLPEKDGSVLPEEDFRIIYELLADREKRVAEIAKALKRRRASLPGDRPGPRGRGDLLAPARRAQGPRRDQRRRRQAGGVPRDHQARRARGDAPPARVARWPDRCVSGTPGARLPGRLHAVAGALAQAARVALGRTRAVGGAAPDLRARERDRGVQGAGILEHPGGVHDAKRRRLPGAPEHARRQQAGQVRARERGRCQARGGGDRGAAVPGRERREEAGAAPPGAAVRDQHLAAGGLAQARLRRRSDHAHRPAPVRRRQSGRRDGRPDHLHAHRQRAALGRGARGLSPSDRRSVRRPLSAGEAAVLSHQDQERPGGARGDPADRPRAHRPRRSGAFSTTINVACTS